MLPFSTWREVFRIPWVRDNSEGVRFLSDVFYLLLALYRSHRFHDFNRLQRLYFKMIDSFAQYGRREAKDTVDRLLEIPWFKLHQRYLYRLIAAYNHAVDEMAANGGDRPGPTDRQMKMNKYVEEYVHCFKKLTHFDKKDEARVQGLVEDTETLNAVLEEIFEALD